MEVVAQAENGRLQVFRERSLERIAVDKVLFRYGHGLVSSRQRFSSGRQGEFLLTSEHGGLAKSIDTRYVAAPLDCKAS